MTAPNIALPSARIAFLRGTSLRAPPTARIPLAPATYYGCGTTRPSRGQHDPRDAAFLRPTCRPHAEPAPATHTPLVSPYGPALPRARHGHLRIDQGRRMQTSQAVPPRGQTIARIHQVRTRAHRGTRVRARPVHEPPTAMHDRGPVRPRVCRGGDVRACMVHAGRRTPTRAPREERLDETRPRVTRRAMRDPGRPRATRAGHVSL